MPASYLSSLANLLIKLRAISLLRDIAQSMQGKLMVEERDDEANECTSDVSLLFDTLLCTERMSSSEGNYHRRKRLGKVGQG